MKKLISLLLTCSMLTCVLTACGEKEESSKSVSSSSSSSSESSEESSEKENDDTEKEESETKEKESEISSKAEEIKKKAEESSKTAEISKEESESSLTDSDEITSIVDVYWECAEQPETAWFAFYPYTDGSNTGVFSCAVDVSDQLSFTKEGNLTFNSTEVPVTMNGNIAKAAVTDSSGAEQVILEMELINNTDAFYDTDGTYEITGGLFYDLMSAMTINSMYLYVNGNKSYCELDACVYTDDGNGNLKITNDTLCSFSPDGSDSTVKYELSGDTLTLTEENGTVTVLKAF